MNPFFTSCMLLFSMFAHDAAAGAPVTRDELLGSAYRHLSQGHLDLAEQEYRTVLTKRPHEKDALLGLAVACQRRLQTECASRRYRQVLDEEMDNSAAAAGLISLTMPTDPVAAESQLKELLDIRPSSPELQHALGNALAYQQRMSEAEHAFSIASSLSPDNALYAYNLAVSLDLLLKPEAALPYYEKSLLPSMRDTTLFDREAVEKRISEIRRRPEPKR